MASGPLAPTLRKARAATLTTRIPLAQAVLASAVPPLFLHVDWQPGVAVDVGSASVGVELADVAVLALVAAAVAVGRRDGFAALRRTRAVWLALGSLAAWIAAATLYGPLVLDGYPTAENLVTAAKFVEYALLAPALAVLVRRPRDGRVPAAALVLWAAAAAAVGLAQFLGADVLDAWRAGYRQPSFLGHHDLAALAGAVFLLGLAALVLAPPAAAWTRALALAAGAVGLVLAAAVASLVGLVLAGSALAVAAARARVRRGRLAGAGALVAAVIVGVLALRGGDLADFLRFAGEDRPAATGEVETYSHRTLLAYLGGRMFLDHPIAGVGWQGSSEPDAFEPYLADARRRFPDTAPLAFPAPERRHGVQNAYVQTLADLGLVGAVLLLALVAAVVARVRRAAASPLALVGTLWLLLAAGLWTAQGLVTGIPLAALTWVALGLVAAADGRA